MTKVAPLPNWLETGMRPGSFGPWEYFEHYWLDYVLSCPGADSVQHGGS